MYTTHEGQQVLSLIRSMAENINEYRRTELRTRLYAGHYSPQWLKKQRKREAEYRAQYEQARKDLAKFKPRMSREDWALCRAHYHACTFRLQYEPGLNLRYVAGWGPIVRLRLCDDSTMAECVSA